MEGHPSFIISSTSQHWRRTTEIQEPIAWLPYTKESTVSDVKKSTVVRGKK
jgi:hypothetical protein